MRGALVGLAPFREGDEKRPHFLHTGHGKRHKPLAAGQEQALLDAIRAIGANPDVAIRALDHRRYHLACAKKHPELYRHEQNREKDSDKRY